MLRVRGNDEDGSGAVAPKGGPGGHAGGAAAMEVDANKILALNVAAFVLLTVGIRVAPWILSLRTV